MKEVIVNATGAALLVLALTLAGASEALGAHPRWASDVAVYAIPVAVMLVVILTRLTRYAVWFALADLAIAGGIAWYGKRIFVASSGENALGGQMWFFGWVAVCACAAAVFALAVGSNAQNRAD